jgi:hypothetical protein
VTGSAETFSRYDLEYLWHILDTAVRLYPGTTDEERARLSDLKDFLTWLCVDAVENESEANALVKRLVWLLEEIKDAIACYCACRLDSSGLVHHGMFLQALVLTLTRKHSVRTLLCRDIDHEKFLSSWEHTKLKLGLYEIENSRKCDEISAY